MAKIVIDSKKCPLKTFGGICKLTKYNCYKDIFIPKGCPLNKNNDDCIYFKRRYK